MSCEGMIGDEIEIAMLQHEPTQVGDHRVCLHIEIVKHFIRLSMFQEANLIGVQVGAQEGHGPN